MHAWPTGRLAHSRSAWVCCVRGFASRSRVGSLLTWVHCLRGFAARFRVRCSRGFEGGGMMEGGDSPSISGEAHKQVRAHKCKEACSNRELVRIVMCSKRVASSQPAASSGTPGRPVGTCRQAQKQLESHWHQQVPD
eukprot:7382922-Prymnesium_polylepis.1